jgi:hypothetical protein
MLWPMAIVLFVLANAGLVAIVAPNRRTAERRHELPMRRGILGSHARRQWEGRTLTIA